MRSRTVREGSVGLLILVGLALFGGLVLWLRGLNFGQRSYQVTVEFNNANDMQVGGTVRYRGVEVGKIINIEPSANGVDVALEISSADLSIPNDVLIEANQSGLVGETSIDIRPLSSLPPDAQSLSPVAPNCDSSLIICDDARLKGQIGVSFEELIRSTVQLANLYGDPAFFEDLNRLTKSTSIAATEVAELSSELSLLSRSVRKEVQTISGATQSVSSSVNEAANRISLAANQISGTAGVTASQVGLAANQVGLSATQLSQLATNLDGFVQENRGNLVSTLDSIRDTSDQLRALTVRLNPTLEQVNSTFSAVNTQQFVQNLETLTANAAEASANLRDISSALNEPTNLLVLQQTLDSARVTFENAQKITSDLDELTGDPAFRQNVRDLVNGLSDLVSSTQNLEQQVRTAQVLEPVSTLINNPVANGERPAPPASPSRKKPSRVVPSEVRSKGAVTIPVLTGSEKN